MVAILLATYNGEKYLKDLLDSLSRQTFTDFIVYMHDDGSTDSTREIINTYIRKDQSKYILLEDSVKHRGPLGSFMWMLEHVVADYYMFCDQDDVWEPDKIRLSIDKVLELEEKYGNVPVMVHTDLQVVDSNLNVIHDSFWEMNGFCVDLHKCYKYACAWSNVFTGCTMIFNQATKEKAFPVSQYASMHDQWIGLVACRYGVVDNIPEKTIKYRQHGNNVCSAWANKPSAGAKGIKGYYEFCLRRRPFLRDLEYGGIIKFIWFNRTYPIRRVIKNFWGV